MTVREILFPVLLGCLAATIFPAVLFRVQPRVACFFPVRGRWLPVFLWTFSVLLFLGILLLASYPSSS